ncbi:MAG: DUF1826 domain-containing protein [Pseudomonadota bacterium]
MTLHSEVEKGTIPGVGVTTSPKGLSYISNPSCAATIWRRQPLESFQTWIDDLSCDQLPRARVILRQEMVRDAMADIVDAAGLPDCQERNMLADDVAALANIFAAVMDAPYLRLRLDVICTNACRNFHIDAVTARLICTYRGSGTQYGTSADGLEPHNIDGVPTGSPMIMRGTLWPCSPNRALRHRSPQIEGTGETRLVLVLDPVTDPASEMDQHLLH